MPGVLAAPQHSTQDSGEDGVTTWISNTRPLASACLPFHTTSHLRPAPGISVCLRTGHAAQAWLRPPWLPLMAFFFFLKGGPSLLQRPMRMSIFLAEGPCCKAKGSGGCVFLGLDSCTYPILSNNCLRPIRCQALCGHEALTLMSKAMCLPWHKLCSCYSPLFLFFYLTNSGSPCSPRGGSHKTSYPDGADRGRAST